ncbi:nucleotidyltransferase domain-containing protein [Segatella hominis]|uniref:nucleotidyltransferase domain-containing protein n=1 Tax=Segatella hominis TaxID=2518605 RepID=UPI003AB99451
MTILKNEHLEDEVLNAIRLKAESIMPKDAKVFLFGSRARRDAKADSDWDLLVLLNKDKIDEQDHDDYTYPFWELGWKINQMIHPIVYSMKDWNSKIGSPFYNNVEGEGLQLLSTPMGMSSCTDNYQYE